MEYQEKSLLLVTALLVVLAVYLTVTAPVAKPAENVSTRDAESLLMNGLSFGAGQPGYVYAYRELSDGYRTSYVLTRNANESLVEIQNPLSSKKIYFLANDTILCISYGGNESCASVQNEGELSNYLNSLRAKFFNDSTIRRNKEDLRYLISKGHVLLNPVPTSKKVESHQCSEVTYALDFSNMSVGDAGRFGVGSATPKKFDWTMCVDNATGYLWEKAFNYTYNGIPHRYVLTLVSYVPGYAASLSPPENLSGGVINILFNEKEQQIRMANCYAGEQGDERDKCLAAIALDNRRKDLCEYAGGRRDRCLVSIVPLTRDETICTAISSAAYRDDCYIELAGAHKNSSWCAMVQNTSKSDFCMGISNPPPTPPPIPLQNASNGSMGQQQANNTTNSTIDINELLDFIDKQGDDKNATGNSTGNSSNGSTPG